MTVSAFEVFLSARLRARLEPDLARVWADWNQLLPKMQEIARSIDEATRARDAPRMELSEAAFRAMEKRLARLLERSQDLIQALQAMAREPEMIVELSAIAKAAASARQLHGALRGWLARTREAVGEMNAVKPVRTLNRGDVAQQWARAEEQVYKARQSAAAARVELESLRARAETLLRQGQFNELTGLRKRGQLLPLAEHDTRAAALGKHLARLLSLLGREAVGPQASAQYTRDSERLQSELKAAGEDLDAARAAQAGLDETLRRAQSTAVLLQRAAGLKMQDAREVVRVLFTDPGRLPKVLQRIVDGESGPAEPKKLEGLVRKALQRA